ncbi:hypothetical protein KIW84_040417 [Lathyrus oleraceus]|uniref:Uncharacterized protein n=1 Tax=Pisum sativum TaxID=3888 RepID=A0A9D5AK31_PEA|nr:hypothetical protein KIW84_040417 [Pisum sativum]
MMNNNNRWSSPSQAYTRSNHGDQPQPESGVDCGSGVHEEVMVVINNGSNDNNIGNRNNIVFGDDYSNIDGVVAEPATGDPRYKQWKSENSLIIVWLVSSMEIGIGKSYIFLPSAKDVWEAVKETYSDIQNSSQIFGLKSKLWHVKQGTLTREEGQTKFLGVITASAKGKHVELVGSSKANLLTGRRKVVVHFRLVILIKD